MAFLIKRQNSNYWCAGWKDENGNGVLQDHKQAVKWYTKAAEQGYFESQSELGQMYYDGDGIPQDCKEAFKWCTKAAEQRDYESQSGLGAIYDRGVGVLQDQTRAHVWYSLAGANGNEIGIENRDSLAKNLTSDQIAEAQKMAREMVAANPKLIGE